MYCSKCGTECSGNSSFCPNCGNPIDVKESSDIQDMSVNASTNKPFKLPLKWIVTAGVILVVIVISIILLIGNSVNSSYENLAKSFVEAFYELDADKMAACYPDFIVENLCEHYRLSGSSRKELSKELAKRIKDADEQKQKVKIISVDIDRELSTGYDIFAIYNVSGEEKEKISQVLDLVVKFSLDGDSSVQNMEIICFKEGSKWYVLNVD